MRYLSEKGFTLIELIVVLAIAGVAVSLVISMVGASREKAVLRQEAAKIRNTLRYARETSLMERIPVALVPDAELDIYRLEKDGEAWGSGVSLADGIEIGGESIVFMPKGVSTGGVITLRDRKERGFAIEVDPVTGRAEVRRL